MERWWIGRQEPLGETVAFRRVGWRLRLWGGCTLEVWITWPNLKHGAWKKEARDR